MTGISLRGAGEGDLAFIMAAERTPTYEGKVGRWSDERHRAALASDDFAYLIGVDALGAPGGFAILCSLNDPSDNVCLQRIVAAEAGRGFGRPFLAAVIDWVYRETACHRLYLDVFTDNLRARHVYKSLGFVEEGVLREVVKRLDGTRVDQVLMSLLRPEWRGAGSSH